MRAIKKNRLEIEIFQRYISCYYFRKITEKKKKQKEEKSN